MDDGELEMVRVTITLKIDGNSVESNQMYPKINLETVARSDFDKLLSILER